MADLRKIDGSVLDSSKLGRNEKIAEILEQLTAQNDAGLLASVAVVSLTHGQLYDAMWAWPDDLNKYPWSFVMLGALATLQAEIIRGQHEAAGDGPLGGAA